MDFYNKIENLERKFIDEKVELINGFIREYAEYWEKIPLLYFIEEGKSGYGSDRRLMGEKMYRIGQSSTYIDTLKSRVVSLGYGKDTYSIDSFGLSTSTRMDSINGKMIYDELNRRIDRHTHTDMSNFIEPHQWIKNSVIYNIEITHDDYKRHYDDCSQKQFRMSKNEFNAILKKKIVEVAKEGLLE